MQSLATFHGRTDESVDLWIQDISFIKDFCHAPDREVISLLPSLLQDSAYHWFRQLTRTELAALTTWQSWQDALRLAFRPPNYERHLLLDAQCRTLSPDEPLTQYFAHKLLLLRQALGESTPEHDLVQHILAGIPEELSFLLDARLGARMTLQELRRTMILLEPLRKTFPVGATHATPRPTRPERPSLALFPQGRDGLFCSPDKRQPGHTRPPRAVRAEVRPTLASGRGHPHDRSPPGPCYRCRGNHWHRDCPQMAAADRPTVRAREVPPPRQPFPPRSPTAHFIAPSRLADVAAPPRLARTATASPVYAQACLSYASPCDGEAGPDTLVIPLCIDTGASTSVIDQALLTTRLPLAQIDKTQPISIQGLQHTCHTVGTVTLDVGLRGDRDERVTWPAVFHVIPDIQDKVILGMDTLLQHRADVMLSQGRLHLEEPRPCDIPISTTLPKQPVLSYLHRLCPTAISTVSVSTPVASASPALLELVDTNPALTPVQKQAALRLLHDHRRAFASGATIGRTNLLSMSIDTSSHAPISLPPYQASPNERRLIDAQLEELEAQGIIEDSNSPWAAPVVLVRKKDGGARVCVDYRRLNALTKTDCYPIPRIDDLLAHLAGKKWFSTFDANKGFHQVPLSCSEDREKTAFRTHAGLKQFTCMPFGLKNGPAVFQRLMDRVLGKHKWRIALVYIDDLIIFSDTFEEHMEHCATVLKLVAQSGLTLSPKKTRLCYQEITALGHCISNLGLGTAKGKIQAVAQWKVPRNAKQVQQFLGLATYYRRFVQGFASTAQPLTRLLAKGAVFRWGPEEAAAFQALKAALISSPILAHPNYAAPFQLYTDASGIGLGAILSQRNAQGHEAVICYTSRQLRPEERNYSATELECLAIVWALRKLHAYVDGAQVELITDHSALQWLYDYKGNNKRILKWSLEIQASRETMKITHRAGREHGNADALSRQPLPTIHHHTAITTCTPQPHALADHARAYSEDPFFAPIVSALTPSSAHANQTAALRYKDFTLTAQGLLYYAPAACEHPRLCVPQCQVNSMLYEYHDAPVAGHLGFDKTYAQLRARFFWPNMAKTVKSHVLSCDSCQRNKASQRPPAGLLQPLPIPSGKWEDISMDFVSGLPPTRGQGFDAILVVVDRLTKMMHAIPTHSDAPMSVTARLFTDHIFRLHGLPKTIVTDRDAKFTSLFWRSLFTLLGTKLHYSTAHHPQTDGQTERANRTVSEMLRHYVAQCPYKWHETLSLIEFAYNKSHHPSIDTSPFLLNYGIEPRAPHELFLDHLQRHDHRDVHPRLQQFVNAMQSRLRAAQDAIQLAQLKQQRYHDQHHRYQRFRTNDLVLLDTRYLSSSHFPNLPKRLRPKFIGPFRVAEEISANAYRLELPTHYHFHPVVNVSLLKPYLGDNDVDPDNLLRYPRSSRALANDAPPASEYQVERLIQRRSRDGNTEYLVKWLGYPVRYATWEPESNLSNYQHLIDDLNNLTAATSRPRRCPSAMGHRSP